MNSRKLLNVREDVKVYDLGYEKKISVLRFLRMLMDVDFRILFYYRIYSSLYRLGYVRLSNVLYYRVKSRYACDIAPGAKIGPGFRIVHGFNIAIGEYAILGAHVKCFNGVSIGKRLPIFGADKSMPTVGDRCILGTGCKLLGQVSLPSDSLVGANVVIHRQDLVKSKGVSIIREINYK